MDQEKIGKFIASCRKDTGLTQAQLAEQIGISDRAVSKWETGKSLPDASNMLELCKVLNISINELLTGEHIAMEEYKEKAEENFLELKRKVDNTVKFLNIIGWFFAGVSILLFVFDIGYQMLVNMSVNWVHPLPDMHSKLLFVLWFIAFVNIFIAILVSSLKYKIEK